MPDHDNSGAEDVEAPSRLPPKPFRILSLDGGGAKGFYTLGVLRELEAMLPNPLHVHFDLVYGTSTGAIIAALLALGRRVEEIHTLYAKHVPHIMSARTRRAKSSALSRLTVSVFESAKFSDTKTAIGVVATRWLLERPMIFKHSVAQAHGRSATFTPGFGVTIADAVQASCSAFPFFNKKTITTSSGDVVELIDGGYCANNPTLYAIADAVVAMRIPRERLRVLSLGVGAYPQPRKTLIKWLLRRCLLSVQLLQKTLEINTQSMEQLRAVLFKDIKTVRVSDTFEQPEMATDFMEHDLRKLNTLRQRGGESFARKESELRDLLLPTGGA
jgi:predicted acylesterase/phospholipase RssA